MHGAKRKKKSDYGLQLEEKQKLKAVFGMISESQLHKYFVEAASRHGNTPEVLMQRLECRLDVVVYRLRLSPTIFGAQQLVSHGHILVNGKKVTCRSFEVRPGMVVTAKASSRQKKMITDSLARSTQSVPEYLEFNESEMSGKLLSLPSLESIPTPIDINVPMVCDFLAHSG
jgi:small subunit ribosomal protein S4